MKQRNDGAYHVDKVRNFASVWDALADTPAEAHYLGVRSFVHRRVTAYIKAKGLTQAAAAQLCNISQPRINDLLSGKASRFSLDALVNIAAAAGLHVEVNFRESEIA